MTDQRADEVHSHYAKLNPIGLLGVALLAAGISACVPQRPASPEADAGQMNHGSAATSVLVTVPRGTEVRMVIFTAVGSATSHVGDTFTARTNAPVVVGYRVPIPRGSIIHGHVTGVSPAQESSSSSATGGAVTLSFDKITTARDSSATLSAFLTSIARAPGRTTGIIGGGIGNGVAAGTRGRELVVHAGTHLAITLDQPLTITDPS